MKSESNEQCWQENGHLHAVDGAMLPPRCVKCNSVQGVLMSRKHYRWKPSAALAMGKLGKLVQERESTITFGVCEQHRKARFTLLVACLTVLSAAFVTFWIAHRIDKPIVCLVGLGLILAAAVVWSFTSILSPKASRDGNVTIYKGAGTKFLESLTQSRFGQF